MNEQGDYIPLWGTCLGFEAMTYVAAGDVDVRVECTGGNNVALPLNFTNSNVIELSFTTSIFLNNKLL